MRIIETKIMSAIMHLILGDKEINDSLKDTAIPSTQGKVLEIILIINPTTIIDGKKMIGTLIMIGNNLKTLEVMKDKPDMEGSNHRATKEGVGMKAMIKEEILILKRTSKELIIKDPETDSLSSSNHQKIKNR